MKAQVGDVAVEFVEHGHGRPVLVLHGAGVDHREPEACFEPIFDGLPGHRRIYPDLPGMGGTAAPDDLDSAEDVLRVLLGFAAEVAGDGYLLIGHSAGGYYGQAMARRARQHVAGLALVCPLLPHIQEVPDHHPVVEDVEIDDEGFTGYFVIHTPEMLERHRRHVEPAAELVDWAAMERIGSRWELSDASGEAFDGPTLIVAGRLDSTVGWRAAADLVVDCPQASLAVLDGTGHALPHEQPALLRALVVEWLTRVGLARQGDSLPIAESR